MIWPFRLGRAILQVAFLPPVNINFNFPQRPTPRPLATVNIPPVAPAQPASFNPARRVTPLQARLLAASNAFWRKTDGA